MHLEEFTTGAIHRHWPNRTVFESDHRLYCALSLNEPHDATLVHPVYLYSLLLGLSMSDISRHALRHEELCVHQDADVRIGETICVETEVLSVTIASPGTVNYGWVVVETRGLSTGGATFMSVQRKLAIRSAAPPCERTGVHV